MLDLSIIIVNFNKAELLKQCLESIYDNIAQTIRFEVIVVDNDSQDSSIKLIEDNFSFVKVLKNTRNRGFAAGNNQGLRIAQGKYLLLLNNDTFVLADAVERLLKFLQENPNVGAVGPALLEPDGSTIQPQGSGRGNKFWLAQRPVETNFLTGAAFMIRRETLEEIGELDENFFFYNEDLDWCRRIKDKKWKLYYIPQARIIHYGGQSTVLNSTRTFVEGLRGGLYYCSKYYRAWFPLYRLLLLFWFIPALLWYTFRLIIWTGKRRSFMMCRGYLQLLGITIFWKYHQNKIRREIFTD